jgi:hypothetical protein
VGHHGPEIVQISLNVARSNVLYVLLHSDGTVNRFGTPNKDLTGPEPNGQVERTIGRTDKPLLQQLLSTTTPELVALQGKHVLDAAGSLCELLVRVQVGDRGGVFQYRYGSSSAGPPAPLAAFVKRAVELTDGWLHEIAAGAKA